MVAEKMTEKAARERLDKWLWQARFYRSRALAQAAASAGRVRVNGNRVDKPGLGIKCGDVLTLPRGREILAVKVLSFGLRRGPAPEAAALYEIVADNSLDPGAPSA
jgi:ribosome-associated heat shock protein Hsp15